jgi:hypothetical protein
MKFLLCILFILLLILSNPMAVQAKDKHAPLPSRVRSANTVYVDNQTTSAELQNVAYTELSKWARLQIVDSPRKADIVLRLSGGTSVRLVSGPENSHSAAAVVPAKQNWIDADSAVPEGFTRISVIDPKTGNSLWSDIRKTNNLKASSHMLDGLRAAFDQEQK